MAKNKTEKISRSLYGGTIKIDFFPGAHRYKMAGSKNWLTSVTAVTGLVDKSRVLINWAIRLAETHIATHLFSGGNKTVEEARAIVAEALALHEKTKNEAASVGHLVHGWAEEYANAKLNGTPLPKVAADMPDQVMAGINGFLDFVKAHNVRFLERERLVFSKRWGFVGTTDAIIEADGIKYIVDWKTGKGIYDEMYFQISAYAEAYREEMGEKLPSMLVHFDKETGAFSAIKVPEKDGDKDFQAFTGLLTAKDRLKERARA